MAAAGATPSQTVGPFFAFGLCIRPHHELVDPGRADALRLEGRVLDGAGEPVFDAMVEIWQADAQGGHRDGFGWGRSGTDADGRYAFVTVKPGGDGAPFITMLVFARGLLKPLMTRIYFPDEPANASDLLLAALTEDERAGLTAVAENGAMRFDIHLQGDRQTTFLAL
ncbi:MAG TPA: protocatechuate 3,4-dioxygenase subunit alpha [Gaiellales bacterium]|nr:protocatechuate 3,4-dioxygenase subunit alpha [Gaiellales bacterium]